VPGEVAIGRQFGIGEVVFFILRKQMKKNCPVALPIENNRSKSSRPPLIRSRDSLLDEKFADGCIDKPLVRAVYGFTKLQIVYALPAGKAGEFLGLVNLHF
jgi:hypothetical protein